jgi:acylphosphatase
MAAYRYVVRGRVQGVGFRYFALRAAESLGVSGFARNLPDGTVEVLGEAAEDALADFEAQLRAGPGFAQVDDVERMAVAPRGDHGFHIR